MTRRSLITGQWTLAVAVTLTCAACSITSTPTNPRTTSTPPTSAVPTDPSSAATSPPAVSLPAVSVSTTILTDAQQEFMLRLEAIKPEIASDDREALSNGAKVCLAIAADTPESQLVNLTAQTFHYYDQPLTQVQAIRVLALVRSQLCPR